MLIARVPSRVRGTSVAHVGKYAYIEPLQVKLGWSRQRWRDSNIPLIEAHRMRMQAHILSPSMRRDALLGVDRQMLRRLRIGMVAVTLVSLLFAACASTGNETTEDRGGATAKVPVKVSAALAQVRSTASRMEK